MKISILAVGTEITCGQITNSNSQWLSKKLNALGFICDFHMACADQRLQILQALEFCAANSELILITGGLGPTTDDFTRDVVAEWAKTPMEFHQESWTHVQNQLRKRGLEPQKMHEKECLFPKNAEVFQNNVGTANGFYFEILRQGLTKKVFVLPGPPREIDGLWKDFLNKKFLLLAKNIDPLITRSWDTFGTPESQVADIVEKLTHDCPFTLGYRAHVPYVEVKLMFPHSRTVEADTWWKKIDTGLQAITILRDGQDIADLLAQKLRAFQTIHLTDLLGSSFAFERILKANSGQVLQKQIEFSNNAKTIQIADIRADEIFFKISIKNETHALAEIMTSQYQSQLEIRFPLRISESKNERMSKYYTERALLFWHHEIPS